MITVASARERNHSRLRHSSVQARVMHEVLALAAREGYRVNLIEAYDQPWKRQFEGTVGGHWGLFDGYRREAKFSWGGRNLPLKLSVTPFCQGLPGSINAVPMPCATIQDNSALDTNAGPLSLRRNVGAPRSLTRRDSSSITRGERMRPSTSIARPSLVNSSVTVRHLSCWPLAQ